MALGKAANSKVHPAMPRSVVTEKTAEETVETSTASTPVAVEVEHRPPVLVSVADVPEEEATPGGEEAAPKEALAAPQVDPEPVADQQSDAGEAPVATVATSDSAVERPVLASAPSVDESAEESGEELMAETVERPGQDVAESRANPASLTEPPLGQAVPSDAEAWTTDGLVAPDTAPGNVRRVVASKRNKRDFNYSWPRTDVEQMRAAHKAFAPLYRKYWEDRDPDGAYRLVFSAFVARALQVAFEDPTPWVSSIRNDARKEPIAGGQQQVGLVWPVAVERSVVDAFEDFDMSLLPEGFALTKQHLAAAAILHGLKSVKEWVLFVPNDDRFNMPVDADGRLQHNRRERVLV